MPIAPPITEIEQLKSHPALARLLEWNTSAVEAAKFDRDELTLWIKRESIREACAILRDNPVCAAEPNRRKANARRARVNSDNRHPQASWVLPDRCAIGRRFRRARLHWFLG